MQYENEIENISAGRKELCQWRKNSAFTLNNMHELLQGLLFLIFYTTEINNPVDRLSKDT